MHIILIQLNMKHHPIHNPTQVDGDGENLETTKYYYDKYIQFGNNPNGYSYTGLGNSGVNDAIVDADGSAGGTSTTGAILEYDSIEKWFDDWDDSIFQTDNEQTGVNDIWTLPSVYQAPGATGLNGWLDAIIIEILNGNWTYGDISGMQISDSFYVFAGIESATLLEGTDFGWYWNEYEV